MHIFSQDFNNGDKIPEKHVFNGMGYNGNNLSPHLVWFDVPLNTKSFVVTCYDPDAPTGSGWWHWIIANIPSTVTMLPQGTGSNIGKLPEGAIQTRTDFGKIGYGGPAPPQGESHRYIFTVHALDIDKIKINQDDSGAMVGFNVYLHKLDSASITVTYP